MRDHSTADDDLLMRRLRDRACDLARRFDKVGVAAEWVVRRHGERHVGLARESGFAFDDQGMISYPAGSAEAVEYYREVPSRAYFPPATTTEVEQAERLIGHRLPPLLRRLYLEVANGGFGPDARGFACLTGGNRDPSGFVWPSVVEIWQTSRERGVLPASWLELTPAGCTMYWHVSLTDAGNPVLLYDADGWYAPQRPEDGVTHVTPSLREWLWTWASGGNLWGEVLGRQ